MQTEPQIFSCDECCTANYGAHCTNPMCVANPSLSQAQRDRIVAEFAAYAERKRQDEERVEQRRRLCASGFMTAF